MKIFKQKIVRKIFIVLVFQFSTNSNSQTVSTLAGQYNQGYVDGIGTQAQFRYPGGITIGNDDTIYVADCYNNCIRKISVDGTVTTLAGSTIAGLTNGIGLNAKFNFPTDVAVSNDGTVFVVDQGNHCVRKITTNGLVSTYAGSSQGFQDGNAIDAQFNTPVGLVITIDGTIYIGDQLNHRIRKITPDGIVSTFAGSTSGLSDGNIINAKFNRPSFIAIDPNNNLIVSDTFNQRVRKISNGNVSTIAGSTIGFYDGNSNDAQFNQPSGIAISDDGTIFISDTFNNRIRKITSSGIVSTVAGSNSGFQDGPTSTATFTYPTDLTIGSDGIIYISDYLNHSIRKLSGVLNTTNFEIENELKIYPNPTNSIINIDSKNMIVKKLSLVDLNGRILELENSFENQAEINISNLKNGIYLMEIKTEKGVIFKKVIKQ